MTKTKPPEPSSLVIEASYPCGHVEGGVRVLETRQDGETVLHRMPPTFVPIGHDALYCFICLRFVNAQFSKVYDPDRWT
jgi:hypothetical protein